MIPEQNDAAIVLNSTSIVPTAQPIAYTPHKGELGVVLNGAFTPIEPFPQPGAYDKTSVPNVVSNTQNNYAFPSVDTSSVTVAAVAVSPFDVANNRAWILDTTPDVSATEEDKNDPNYKPNPGLSLLSKTHQDFDLEDFTDVDGVAYKWDFQPVCTEFQWVKQSDIHGRFFARHYNNSALYYSYNASTWVLMPPAGVELIYNGTTARNVYIKTPGQPTVSSNNPYLRFAINFNAYGIIGKAPDSYVDYSVDTYLLRCAWPSPTLRTGQTKYNMYNGVGSPGLYSVPTASSTTGTWAGTSPACYLRSYPFKVRNGDAIVFTTSSAATPYTRSSASLTQTLYYVRDVQWIGLYTYFNVASTPGGSALPATNSSTYYYRAPFDTGNSYDGTAFIPSVGTSSGLLLTQGYKKGLQMSVTTEPYTPVLFQGEGGGFPIVAKIGKVTSAWDSAAKTLTLTSPTPLALFRYSLSSDPMLSVSLTPYTDTSPAAYFTSGATDPGFVNGDIIRFTTTPPLPWLKADLLGYEVRDLQVINDNYFFNLSDTVGGAAVAPWDSGSGVAFNRAYTAPLAIDDSATVSFFAEKGGSVSSDDFSVTVSYDGVTPPANFTTNFWSTPYAAVDNNTSRATVQFQRRADWYCSPTGGGTGLTPNSPATLDYVCGDSSAYGTSLGRMDATLTWTAGSTKKFALTATGDLPSGYKIYYGLGVDPNTLYSTTVAVTTPTEVRFELRKSDATTKVTNIFRTLIPGTGTTTITADWNDVTKKLTLSGAPTGATILCDTTATPVTPYTGPFTVPQTAIYNIKLIYKTNQVIAYTDVKAITQINPSTTATFSTTYTMTWVTPAFTFTGIRAGDVVWACEGYYVPTVATRYFRVKPDVILRGGFNTSFTERNTSGHKSYINTTVAKRFNIQQDGIGYGMIDGFYANACTGYEIYYDSYPYQGPTWLFVGHHIKDCHVDIEELSLPGTPVNTSQIQYRLGAFGGYYNGGTCHDCTCNITMIVQDAGSGAPAIDYEDGGSNWCAVWIFSSVSRSGGTAPRPFNCTANVIIDSGDAGDGNNGNFSTNPQHRSGMGGSTTALFYCYGAATDSQITFSCTSGKSGRGGHWTDYTPPYGALSGDTNASAVMTLTNRSTAVGDVSTGTSGTGPESTSGGNAYASLTSSSYGTGLNETYSVIAGDALPIADGYGESKATLSRGGGRVKSTGVMYVESGETPSISAGSWCTLYDGELGYLPQRIDLTTVHGGGNPTYDRTWISQSTSACYFDQDVLDLTEATPNPGDPASGPLSSEPVNAVRINAITGRTIGWYGGTVNSNGAPLDAPYDTPQGSGYALGRYWE